MSLQAKLHAFKAAFRSGEPPYSVLPSTIAAMDRATRALIDSGAVGLAREAGQAARSKSMPSPRPTA
jgi:hypothetical protein